MKKILTYSVLTLCFLSCNRIDDNDFKTAYESGDPDLFIEYEEGLNSIKDKNEYFFKLVKIQENSGLAFGYYDPRDIKHDSMFKIYKANIHFVYKTYFNSFAFKVENNGKINSEQFQDMFFIHKAFNNSQKDSITSILNFKIPL